MNTALKLFQTDPAPAAEQAPGNLFPDLGDVLTVAAVIDRRLGHLRRRVKLGKLTDGALGRDRHYLEAFAAGYGRKLIRQCIQEDLYEWIEGHPSWKSGSTLRDALTPVISAFKWAVEDAGLIARNPYRWPKDLQLETEARPPLEEAEYATLMATARTHRRPYRRGSLGLRVGLYFMRHTGVRPSEMREITWGQVNWDKRELTFEKHKTRKKTGRARRVPLKGRVVRLLRRLECRDRQAGLFDAGEPGGSPIFLNGDKKPWTPDAWEKHFRRWATKAGIPKKKSTYGLRHYFAVEMIELGYTTKQVADILGHTSTRTVEKWYASHTRHRDQYLLGLVDDIDRRKKALKK